MGLFLLFRMLYWRIDSLGVCAGVGVYIRDRLTSSHRVS